MKDTVARDGEGSPELHARGLGGITGARQALLAEAGKAGIVVVAGQVDERREHRERFGVPTGAVERRCGLPTKRGVAGSRVELVEQDLDLVHRHGRER